MGKTNKQAFERGHSYSYVNGSGDRVIVNETRNKKDVMTLSGDWGFDDGEGTETKIANTEFYNKQSDDWDDKLEVK